MRLWQHGVAHTAQALAAVLTRSIGDADLDVVLTARAAVLDHVETVLGDLAPRARPDRPKNRRRVVPLAGVETDPIGSLGLVLHGRGRPHLDRSPSELLDLTRPVDPATADWIQVGRRALLADRAWSGPTVGNLEPAAAWHALGEIAALAEAIAVLDVDLAAAAQRPDVQSLIATTAGLRLVAREVLALADPNGDTRPTPPALGGPEGLGVVSPADGVAASSTRKSSLAKETRRVTVLLDETTELTPYQIRACAQVARDLCLLTAASATSFTGADLRGELGDIARALHTAAKRNRGEFSLNAAPARALELQLRDLHATTKLAFANGVTLNPDDANRVARRLPDLVEVLADKTHAQIDRGRWAVPDRTEDGNLPYAFASCSDSELTPPMLPALRKAAEAAGVLRNHVAHPASGDAASPALADALGSLRAIVLKHGNAQERGAVRRRAIHPAQSIRHSSAAAPSI